MPSLDDVLPYLQQIWDTRMLTNRGPMVHRLEAALCQTLQVPHVSLVANATLGLTLGLRHLGVSDGEVITTPFSFVASAHAIRWVGAVPVFADIDPQTFNLDPKAVEALITPRTRAIMPIHAFGTPCDTAALAELAAAHDLKLIYDAAHAFAVGDPGGSVLRHGDLSVLSFHATKVFNTFEGGAVILPDAESKEHFDRLCNFGICSENDIEGLGLNAKMSEFNAAVGLAQLPNIDAAIGARARVRQRYREGLADVPGLLLPSEIDGHQPNHYAFPILVTEEHPEGRDALWERLNAEQVHARRYFYPLLSDVKSYRDHPSADDRHLPCARRVADQVLCLPTYADLSVEDQDRVIALVRDG